MLSTNCSSTLTPSYRPPTPSSWGTPRTVSRNRPSVTESTLDLCTTVKRGWREGSRVRVHGPRDIQSLTYTGSASQRDLERHLTNPARCALSDEAGGSCLFSIRPCSDTFVFDILGERSFTLGPLHDLEWKEKRHSYVPNTRCSRER